MRKVTDLMVTVPKELAAFLREVAFRLTSDEIDDGASGVSAVINFASGPNHVSTLTGNATFTFVAPASDRTLHLRLVQDATGGRTVTWPASVRWPGGAPPAVNTAAGTTHVITFFADVSVPRYYGISSALSLA